MTDLTDNVEKLKALRERITKDYHPHMEAWKHTGNGYLNLPTGYEGEFINWNDADLMAAAPDLLDALIAEKQAHAKLREEVEAMREDWERTAERSASARDSHEHPAKAAYARHLKSHQNVIRRLTHILGAEQ